MKSRYTFLAGSASGAVIGVCYGNAPPLIGLIAFAAVASVTLIGFRVYDAWSGD